MTDQLPVAQPQVDRFLSTVELKQNIERIHEALKETMKDGIHYGKIPGTDKKSLLKPGAEMICSMFRLSAYPTVEDLSTADKVHYRVTVALTHIPTGKVIGYGVGEASSDEEKYRWRAAVCKQEFDAEDPGRRRVKWRKGGNEGAWKTDQVRTNPADVGNTILKMAKKRGLVDATLTATGASDVFGQDAEDLPPEIAKEIYGSDGDRQSNKRKRPGSNGHSETVETDPSKLSGNLVGEAPLRILRNKLTSAGKQEADLCKELKIKALEELPVEWVNRAMQWAEARSS